MRLEELLRDVLPLSIKELTAKSANLAKKLIPDDAVDKWAQRGIQIRRGFNASHNESVAIVQIVPITLGDVKAVEFRVPYKINGHQVHEVHPVVTHLKGFKETPHTTDDLLDLIERIVRKQRMASDATKTVDS